MRRYIPDVGMYVPDTAHRSCCILRPQSWQRVLWDVLMVFLLVVVAVELPCVWRVARARYAHAR